VERRLIIALLLSMGVLYVWNVIINPPPLKPPKTAENTPAEVAKPAKAAPADANLPNFDEEAEESDDQPKMLPKKGEQVAEKAEAKPVDEVKPEDAKAEAGAIVKAEESGDKAAAEVKPEPEIKVAPPKEELVVIETEKFRAVFTSHGAKLKNMILKEDKYSHPDPQTGEMTPVDIVTAEQPANLPYTLSMFKANFEFNPEQAFEIVSQNATSVTFKTETPQGVWIEKKFELEQDYLFRMDVTVINEAGATISFLPKMRLVGYQNDEDLNSGFMGTAALNLQIPKAFIGGELWEEMDVEALEAAQVKKGDIFWTAVDDRYFLLSLMPPEEAEANQRIVAKRHSKTIPSKLGDGETQVNWLVITHMIEEQTIKAGDRKTLTYKAYIGPKEYETLKGVGRRLEEAIDFWILGFLAIPMLWILNWSFGVIPNYGVAIIILTIIIKLVLYPLTQKSFQSMQKMKDLKPKIDVLKEKVGDDKAELNKKMMELYKQEGVNPLGGCLPMLLQMPVYIALYKMLQNAVELYNAPFIPGWLNDLVMPDPYYILPVLLAGFMFVQQKLTPNPDSQQQKMMMYMMPAMMFVFMLWLPSGLVLYILANTVMSIGQQWWIGKKAEKAKLAAASA